MADWSCQRASRTVSQVCSAHVALKHPRISRVCEELGTLVNLISLRGASFGACLR